MGNYELNRKVGFSKEVCSKKFHSVAAVAGVILCAASAQAAGFGSLGSFGGGVRTDQGLDLDSALRGVESNPAIRAMLARNKANDLRVQNAATDKEVSTIKFKHFFSGLEVMGSQAFYHVADGKTAIDDNLARFDLNIVPTLSEKEAIGLAQSFSGNDPLSAAPSLKILPSEDGDSAQLVYAVRLQGGLTDGGREVQLDAHTGELIAVEPDHINLAPIKVFNAKNIGVKISPKFAPDGKTLDSCAVMDISNGQTSRIDGPTCEKLTETACQVLSLSGSPYTINPQGCKLEVQNSQAAPDADASAIQAAKNSTRVLSYYLQVHNRNGFDNRGSLVSSVVHVGDSYDNAFWSTEGNFMSYGDGDGKELGDFTKAVDVAGHEMTHGVVQYTANLGHTGETASLNEAYADFFGKMIENQNKWVIGTDIFLHPAPGEGIRDLANPGNLKGQFIKSGHPVEAPYPSKRSEMAPTTGACTDKNDYCWAHFNATVPGHASYLIHQAIGRQNAEHLYYVTLSQFLNERAKFKDAAAATLKACSTLFDQGTCAKVEDIFVNQTEMLTSRSR